VITIRAVIASACLAPDSEGSASRVLAVEATALGLKLMRPPVGLGRAGA
jgi:hypothetical protein